MEQQWRRKREPCTWGELVVAHRVVGIGIACQDVGDGSGAGASPTVAGDLIALSSALASAAFGNVISAARSAAPNVRIFEFALAWQTCALPIALALPPLLGETALSDDEAAAAAPGLFDWLTGAHWLQVAFLSSPPIILFAINRVVDLIFVFDVVFNFFVFGGMSATG